LTPAGRSVEIRGPAGEFEREFRRDEDAAALAGARSVDLILIPCRCGILDLRSVNSTIDLAKLAKKPAVVVLNSVPPGGSLVEDADQSIEDCRGSAKLFCGQ
jgi:hypothetical protein